MATKSLVVNEVQNGYILIDTVENKVTVYEKDNELELIKHLCLLLKWKDVIDFGPETSTSPEQKGDLITLFKEMDKKVPNGVLDPATV